VGMAVVGGAGRRPARCRLSSDPVRDPMDPAGRSKGKATPTPEAADATTPECRAFPSPRQKDHPSDDQSNGPHVRPHRAALGPGLELLAGRKGQLRGRPGIRRQGLRGLPGDHRRRPRIPGLPGPRRPVPGRRGGDPAVPRRRRRPAHRGQHPGSPDPWALG
jgi:hypothetical protein